MNRSCPHAWLAGLCRALCVPVRGLRVCEGVLGYICACGWFFMCVRLLVYSVCTVYCSTWFIDCKSANLFLYYFFRLPTFIQTSLHLAYCLSLSRHRGLQRAVTPQKRRTWRIGKVHYQLFMYSACLSLVLWVYRTGCMCIGAFRMQMLLTRVISESKAMLTPDI